MVSKAVKPKLFQLLIKKIISMVQCDKYSDHDRFWMPQLRYKMRFEIRFVCARLLQLTLCSHYFSDWGIEWDLLMITWSFKIILSCRCINSMQKYQKCEWNNPFSGASNESFVEFIFVDISFSRWEHLAKDFLILLMSFLFF